MNQSLTLESFMRLFNAAPEEFDLECRSYISRSNFSYRLLQPAEQDRTVLNILKQIDSETLSQAGPENKERWERGWLENLNNFVASGYNPKELVPKYVRPDQPLRLFQRYVLSQNSYFELDFFTILRLWLFKNYFHDVSSIYEFACGPGYNLHLIASLFPEKALWGMDWSTSSVELVNIIGKQCDMNIKGYPFNMFDPDEQLAITPDSAVFTIGGLEQLGKNFSAFIEYLLSHNPARIIHIEPVYELYDENNLVDYLAMRFHSKRNYLMGLLPYLKSLETNGRITIHKVQRVAFGSLFHDGWSIICYSPR